MGNVVAVGLSKGNHERLLGISSSSEIIYLLIKIQITVAREIPAYAGYVINYFSCLYQIA
jgi:hypothetical protein